MSKSIKILHFGDTHITPRQEFIKEDFFAALEIMNNLPHDFSIFSGDLTQDGLYEDFVLAEKLRKLIPSQKIYWIIGNHDSRNGGFEIWEKSIGPREFNDRTDDYLFIGLDSCIPDRDGGRFGREALDYTKKILTKHNDAPVKLVAFHHHLLPIPKTGRERSNAIDAGDMLSILLDFGVDAVFTGHKHYPNVYKLEDTIIISSGSVSSYKTRSGGPRTLNYVEIIPNEAVKVKTITTTNKIFAETKKTITKRFRMVNSSGGKWIRIAQIAGTDFGTSWPQHNELLIKGLQLLKKTNPDYIIHCGNLTAHGLSQDYEEGVKTFSPFAESFIMCPGPNDLKGYGEILFNKYFDMEQIIDKENYSFYILNTSAPEVEHGVVGRTTRNRLERYVYRTKSEQKGKFDIVVMHHHIIPIAGTRETSALEDAGDVLRTLTDTEVNLVLTGHMGRAFATRVEKTVFVNCNTFASQMTTSMENSFNIIDVSQEGAVVISEVCIPSGFRRILSIFPGK